MKVNDLKYLSEKVSPQNVRQYALANGWQRVPNVNGGIALFNRPDSDLDQLIIPLQPTAPDYARRIMDVVAILADRERRPAEEILNDLLIAADVLRYRTISADTQRGDLALEDGLRILDGAKRSLLAAACSVVSPVSYHPRMSRTEATQFLDSCRLLQTERGSFTVAIACPMRAVEEQKRLFGLDAPFARRTTELLMRSLVELAQALETDNVASLYEAEANRPVISANLCDAILRMQPPDEKSQLSISVTWSGMRPPAGATSVCQEVTFQHDDFPILEDVYNRLRPAPAPAESLFAAYVDALNGYPSSDGRMQGETRFMLVHEEESIRAKTELSADDYQKAVEAHRAVKLVKFLGVLHLGRRIHRITGVRNFTIMTPTT